MKPAATRLLGGANDLALGLGSLAAALMMVHVSLDVIGKALLRMPIPGTLEFVSTYYMVACIFLPMGWVQWRRQHIAVELMQGSLPPRIERAMQAFADTCMLVFALLLCAASFGEALEQTAVRETSEAVALRIEVWPSRWFPVVGSALVACALLLQMGAALASRRVEGQAAPGGHA
ncbi:MAG: TRAP transporter small permease [Betaproteobacteria bacterium]|nr:TRAP transporter small permease [Betaproteobacteria bacterium]